eukprot:8228652-Alexandrium_andersonii.AAC.1
MSASLVGSEMCIRDRRPPSGRTAGQSRSSPLGAPSSGKGGLRGEDPNTCLLYTSDAADDM